MCKCDISCSCYHCVLSNLHWYIIESKNGLTHSWVCCFDGRVLVSVWKAWQGLQQEEFCVLAKFWLCVVLCTCWSITYMSLSVLELSDGRQAFKYYWVKTTAWAHVHPVDVLVDVQQQNYLGLGLRVSSAVLCLGSGCGVESCVKSDKDCAADNNSVDRHPSLCSVVVGSILMNPAMLCWYQTIVRINAGKTRYATDADVWYCAWTGRGFWSMGSCLIDCNYIVGV